MGIDTDFDMDICYHKDKLIPLFEKNLKSGNRRIYHALY